jgi:hypothetical protein
MEDDLSIRLWTEFCLWASSDIYKCKDRWINLFPGGMIPWTSSRRLNLDHTIRPKATLVERLWKTDVSSSKWHSLTSTRMHTPRVWFTGGHLALFLWIRWLLTTAESPSSSFLTRQTNDPSYGSSRHIRSCSHGHSRFQNQQSRVEEQASTSL